MAGSLVVLNKTPYNWRFAEVVFKANSATPVGEEKQVELENIDQFVELVTGGRFEITDTVPDSMKTDAQRLTDYIAEIASLKEVLKAREAYIGSLEAQIAELKGSAS